MTHRQALSTITLVHALLRVDELGRSFKRICKKTYTGLGSAMDTAETAQSKEGTWISRAASGPWTCSWMGSPITATPKRRTSSRSSRCRTPRPTPAAIIVSTSSSHRAIAITPGGNALANPPAARLVTSSTACRYVCLVLFVCLFVFVVVSLLFVCALLLCFAVLFVGPIKRKRERGRRGGSKFKHCADYAKKSSSIMSTKSICAKSLGFKVLNIVLTVQKFVLNMQKV